MYIDSIIYHISSAETRARVYVWGMRTSYAAQPQVRYSTLVFDYIFGERAVLPVESPCALSLLVVIKCQLPDKCYSV